jgi:hypothetical protein
MVGLFRFTAGVSIRSLLIGITNQTSSGGGGGGGGGGTPNWLPAGAVVFADFQNDHYYANGSETNAVSLFVTELSNAGVEFDPTGITTGVGYQSASSPHGNRGGAFAPAITEIFPAFTAVFDYDWDGTAGASISGEIFASPGYETDVGYRTNQGPSHTSSLIDYDANITSTPEPGALVGANKMALTFSGSTGHAAISMNGQTVSSLDGVTVGSPANEFYFRISGVVGITLRSITVYPAADDTDLPALSALPPEIPEWLPAGAVAYADFSAGHYYAGGAETTLDGVLPGAPAPADGTLVATDPINFSGAFLTTLLSDATLVIEGPSGSQGQIYIVDDAVNYGLYIQFGDTPFIEIYSADQDITADDVANPSRKAAFTYTNAKAALSSGGADAVSFATTGTYPAVTQAMLRPGSYSTITVYPPQLDADLPALSAIESSTPEWLPDGAVAFADFVNGHYYAGGAETTVDGVLAEDNSNWQFFDTADITPGIGYVTTSNRGPVIAHSALGTLLTAGFTAVVDFDTNALNARILIEVTDFPDYAAEFSASLHTDGASDDYNLQSATEFASEALGMTEGSHKLAFTFKSDGAVAASRDGATALTLASGAAPSAATDIGFTFDTLIVRSITIYPPQDDADLPALSALPTPAWLPAGYSIYIEPKVLDGFATGRAWVNDAVVTDLTTVFGTGATDNAYGATAYDAGNLTSDGYTMQLLSSLGFIGALRTALVAGATVVFEYVGASGFHYYLVSEDGASALYCEGNAGQNKIVLGSYATASAQDTSQTFGATNRVALTMVTDKISASLNGGAVVTVALTESDWPPGAITDGLFDASGMVLASLGVRTAVADDADLPALSAL